jgi:hypothetical protein
MADEGGCFRARESVLGTDVALRADALRDHAAQERSYVRCQALVVDSFS